ncbi:hypothetical protein [Chryseosolibacter indicus]|uniref:Uncharacterized protein n=1 Tax=Chryseosolibacter indicus TaxID=2782351 RepID=A0ABS5VLJ2_9BACT|nr:hypothetical protein [Chryseosolibacter indicus]MBT1701690.1 hypothetical protein [Chryseosolibacter indicus]
MEQQLVKELSISLNRKKGKFQLQVESQLIEQNVCEFLQTFSFLVGKNVEEYLLNTDSCYDFVRIPLTGCGKTVTLNLQEFIRFRSLFEKQMFQLKLEDLLFRKGIRFAD